MSTTREVLLQFVGKKVTEALISEIMAALPQTGSASRAVYPNITKDGLEYKYCSKHHVYEPVSEFALKGDKLVSWCKEIDKAWTKAKKEAEKAKAEIMQSLLNGSLQAEDARKQVETLEADYKTQAWIETVPAHPLSFPA